MPVIPLLSEPDRPDRKPDYGRSSLPLRLFLPLLFFIDSSSFDLLPDNSDSSSSAHPLCDRSLLRFVFINSSSGRVESVDPYWEKTGPSKRNQKISSRFGEFGDRRFREPSSENRDNPPIPTDLASVRSRSTTVKHWRRPELSPASIPAVVAASKGENRRPPASSPPLPRSRPPFG
ncbi:hypothetical protein CRG98_025555 [Punica granatum]|uniref:Uncharacterized protein n=1 Tax=Punica granatum TaxID=22663 RepID=A0A2I0JCT5_PUNGR|nr:hypothetical protein CRG98_025555 [Punica granatum]